MPLADLGLNLLLLISLVVACSVMLLVPLRTVFVSILLFVSISASIATLLLRYEIAYRAGYMAGLTIAADCDNAPPVVACRKGMTLCSGQTAILGPVGKIKPLPSLSEIPII